VVAALQQALKYGKSQKPPPPEADLANAHYLLLGYLFNLGEYAEAARVGEAFVRASPRAPRAGLAAVYTAEALDKIIREGAGEAVDDYTKMPQERQHLYEFGRYMAERWPGDKAGTYGQHLITEYVLRRPSTAMTKEAQEAEKRAREKE